MKLHERLGRWVKRKLNQLLLKTVPWKPGTVLSRDEEIFVVLDVRNAPVNDPDLIAGSIPSMVLLSLFDGDFNYYEVKMVQEDGKVIKWIVSELAIIDSFDEQAPSFWKVVSR